MPSSLASSALRSPYDMVASHDYRANVMTHGAAWQAEKTGSDQAAMARGLYSDLMVAAPSRSSLPAIRTTLTKTRPSPTSRI